MALRGTAGQMALAEWLIGELDQTQHSQNSAKHEYRPSGAADDLVRVFYLKHNESAQELQEIATVVRSIGDIRRLFTHNTTRALVLRGTGGQIAMADWLVNELDNAASPQALAQNSQNPAPREFRLAGGGGEDLVRVFYLTHAGTVQRLQEIAVQVRTMTQIRRIFTYTAPRVLALRGTDSQIALADRLIKERDK